MCGFGRFLDQRLSSRRAIDVLPARGSAGAAAVRVSAPGAISANSAAQPLGVTITGFSVLPSYS